jgi:hypothetical protein
MGIDFSKKGRQDLIDIEIKKVGIFYSDNQLSDKYDSLQYLRPLKANDAYYYNDVIECLVNLEPLKNIFLNRKELLNRKIIQDKKNLTYYFYKLMHYMWYWEPDNKKDDEDQSIIFMEKIKSLFNDDNLLKDINSFKLLIESILLSIHYEYPSNYKNKDIIYNLNEMKKNNKFYSIKSIIQDIVFFDLLLDSECKYYKNCKSTNYMIYLDLDNLSKKVQTIYDIENILKNYKMNLTCNFCKKTNISKIAFSSYPKVLIIIIDKEINNIKFKYENQISIKTYNKEEVRYELISIIKNKNGKNNKVETFFYSSNDKIWYKFNEYNENAKIEINNLLNNINSQNNNIPRLLIYQKL